MTRFKKTAARWSAGVLLLVSSVTFTSYGRPRTTLQANSDNNGILWILFNYANWDTGLISFSNLFKLPSFVWRSGPAAFDWSRAKIAASGDTAYILYDYTQWDTGLLVYHAGAKAPSLVWRSGPAAFDWSRAKIAASGDSAYILYDYTQCDTGLLVYHAGAKAPVMVWSSGIGEFDWNKATIGASDEPPPPAPVVGGNDMTKVYYSDNEWSGEGKEFSRWYTFRTPPAPEGYIVDGSPKYELVGDRSCGSYAECRAAAQPDVRGVVTVQFRMQGHDEGPLQWGVRAFGINTHDKNKDGISFYTEGRKATSLLIVTVNYRKK